MEGQGERTSSLEEGMATPFLGERMAGGEIIYKNRSPLRRKTLRFRALELRRRQLLRWGNISDTARGHDLREEPSYLHLPLSLRFE